MTKRAGYYAGQRFSFFFMSKRALAEEEGAGRPQPGADPRAPEEVEMGEFEDPYEDEIESDGEVVDGEGDDAEMDVAADDEPEPASRAFIPGVDELPEGQKLVADQSAYHMFHQMNVTWPCLSFDFLRDHLGPARQTFPHTAYLVAGTQADIAKNNEVLVLKASSMYRTSKDDGTCSARGDDALRHLTDMHLHMSKNPRYLLNLLSHAQSS